MREIYQLTRKSFNGLDNEVMPGDLIDKLRPLEDHQFFSLTNLFGAVAKLIGAKQTNTYRKVILKHISFSCHRFDHVIREYKKRETRRRSKCSLCCRQFYNDTWHYNTDEPDFMSRAEFNALERTTVHEDHENWVHEYLLRCPSCGTYYWKENHIVWSVGTKSWPPMRQHPIPIRLLYFTHA